ncbi:MAG: PQQ-dependent sugar dehydrogenase [Bacteroidales bacterium]|nr:PQQ-dependent sugar dehydrogenase [Bacteroidales bacterium]
MKSNYFRWSKNHLLLTGVFILLPLQYACNQNVRPTSTDSPCNYVDDWPGPNGTVSVQAETVVVGLEIPWAIAFLPDGDLLVTERTGRLRLVKDYAGKAQLIEKPVATFQTASTAEGGLLGIALHPQFSSNRLFYVYVTINTNGNPMNQVEQWKLANDGTSAEKIKVIFDGINAARYHNGGRISFGLDGMLYIGTGDAREPNKSQDPKSPNGKLLRVTPDGQVPKDNPIPGNPLYLLGVRNTEGWAYAGNNTIWLTDHGPSGEMGRTGHDEVSIAKPGENLGWPTIYGCETKQGLISPVLTWRRAVPPGGAAIYSGNNIPEWKGNLLIGSLGAQHLHRAVIENGKLTKHEVYFKNEYGRIREVVMGPDRHLYITTSNCDGGNCADGKDRILRIVRK